MNLLKWAAILTPAWTASCQLVGTLQPGGRPLAEANGGGHELRLLDVDSPLRAEQRVPVLSTPEVFAAYVPSHARGDLLIGEHWVFFKLKESEWFVERLADPEPPTAGEAPPEKLRPLEALEWKRVVVPYRRGAQP